MSSICIACIQAGSANEINLVADQYYSDQVWIHSRDASNPSKIVSMYEERLPLYLMKQHSATVEYLVGYIQNQLAFPVKIRCIEYISFKTKGDCENGPSSHNALASIVYWYPSSCFIDVSLIVSYLKQKFSLCRCFTTTEQIQYAHSCLETYLSKQNANQRNYKKDDQQVKTTKRTMKRTSVASIHTKHKRYKLSIFNLSYCAS